MSKKKTVHELINVLAIALRHKIGSIVNSYEIYAQRYAKDAENLLKEAGRIALRENWNMKDKAKIREETKLKLRKELESKDFLDNRKFELMDSELEQALKLLNLV